MAGYGLRARSTKRAFKPCLVRLSLARPFFNRPSCILRFASYISAATHVRLTACLFGSSRVACHRLEVLRGLPSRIARRVITELNDISQDRRSIHAISNKARYAMYGCISQHLIACTRVISPTVARRSPKKSSLHFYTPPTSLLLHDIDRIHWANRSPNSKRRNIVTMDSQACASDVSGLLSRMQRLASGTQRVEDDQDARAKMLQLSRELTATLEQPDEVVSLVAFSVRRFRLVLILDLWLINKGRPQHVCESSR